MQKISLDLDELTVVTFEPTATYTIEPFVGSDTDVSWQCTCDEVICLQTETTSDY